MKKNSRFFKNRKSTDFSNKNKKMPTERHVNLYLLVFLFIIIVSIFPTASLSQIQTIIPCSEDSAFLYGFDFNLNNPDIMYAVYAQHGVFKSNNTGINWDRISSIEGLTKIIINPDQPYIAYALVGG